MDNQHLSRYFPLDPTKDHDILTAQHNLRHCAHQLADEINRTLPEGQAKNEMLMRLLHLMRDVDLALQLDGVSRTRSMVVTN